MPVLRIAKMGNPVLLRTAEPVADPTAPEIRRLAADMQETLEDIGASGLAAPQVFVSKRVVVYRMIASRIPEGSGIKPRPWTVMVNPVITPKTQTTTPVWERCLSVPGLHGKVPRYLDIHIRYQTLDGILYPQRMTDLSLLAYNEEPGPLAREVHENPSGSKTGIDPLFIDLVDRWPGRERWFPK
jgi:peptide deformylase